MLVLKKATATLSFLDLTIYLLNTLIVNSSTVASNPETPFATNRRKINYLTLRNELSLLALCNLKTLLINALSLSF